MEPLLLKNVPWWWWCFIPWIIAFLPDTANALSTGRELAGTGLFQHNVETSSGVKRVLCHWVQCPKGTEVKICEEDGGNDRCVACPKGTKQMQPSNSSFMLACAELSVRCAEEEELDATGKCVCKPGYCGKPPDCRQMECPGFSPDPTTYPSASGLLTSTVATTATMPSASTVIPTHGSEPTTTSPPSTVATTPRAGEAGEAEKGSDVAQNIGIGVGVLALVGLIPLAYFIKKRCFARPTPANGPSLVQNITFAGSLNTVQIGENNVLNGVANGRAMQDAPTTNGRAFAPGRDDWEAENGEPAEQPLLPGQDLEESPEEGPLVTVEPSEERRQPIQESGSADSVAIEFINE